MRDESPVQAVRARIFVIAGNAIETPAAVDVQEWRQDAQWRRQQQRYGRAEPDGSSLPRGVGMSDKPLHHIAVL